MKAVVKNVSSDEIPLGAEPAPVVVVEVDFLHDDGTLNFSQKYGLTPDQLGDDFTLFDRQAEVMQRDIDELVTRAEREKENRIRFKPVDDKVDELRRHFQLEFNDQVPLQHISDHGVTNV